MGKAVAPAFRPCFHDIVGMAQVSLNNDEPLKIIHLVEQLFPEVKLDPIKKTLEGLTFSGTFTVNKVTGKGETLTVKVIFPS